MDLLKTILLYMSLTFATSVQMAPEPVDILNATPVPTVYVQPATPTPVPTPKPSDQTGDETNLTPWFLLGAAMLLVIAVLIVLKKRAADNE